MLRSRIVGLSFNRTNRPLSGNTSLQLRANLICAPFFERISTSRRSKHECAEQQQRQGLHLLILEKRAFIATL